MKKMFLICLLIMSHGAYGLGEIQVTVYNELSDTLSVYSKGQYPSNWREKFPSGIWDDALKSAWVTRNQYITMSYCELLPQAEIHAVSNVKFSVNNNLIGELQLKNIIRCDGKHIEHLAQINPTASPCQITSQQVDNNGVLDVVVHCKK